MHIPMQMLVSFAAVPELFAEAAHLQLLHGHFSVALGIVTVSDDLALGSIDLAHFFYYIYILFCWRNLSIVE